MSADVRDIARLLADASSDTRDLVRSVLEQEQADHIWARQVGPAFTQADTARLLDVTVQAVSKNRGLLRVTNRDGRVVYPILQFDGRRPLPGLADVLRVIDGVLEPFTVASWLTHPTPALADRTPVQCLRDGDVGSVLAHARRTAHAAA